MGPKRGLLALAATALWNVAGADWLHGWDTVGQSLWVDFAGAGYQYTLTDEQAKFVANTYPIVSLEKCFAQANYSGTEAAVVATARRLKSFNPNVKVLFYWSTPVDFSDCYAAGTIFQSRPDWWLKDDAGTPYGSGTRHYHDFTQTAVQQYWTSVILNASAAAPGFIDGVFADGTTPVAFANMSPARNALVLQSMYQVLNSTQAAMHAAFPAGNAAQLIGNGWALYGGETPDHGLAGLAYMDGIVFEHFNTFEMLDPNNGTLVPAKFDQLAVAVRNASSMGKTVLIKGWPGPCTTPIEALGPQYPDGSAPTTYQGRAAAAAAYLTQTLAPFLIVAEANVWLSYSTWYTAPDGVYPCPDAPDTCSTPANWYPEFSSPLGSPLGPSVRISGGSGWVYARNFSSAYVQFDAAGVNSTTTFIQWH